MANTSTVYDVLIAGAGPAGCVLASRLSENGAKQILLVESGSDMRPGEEHPDILDPFAPSAYSNPAFHWKGLVAEDGPDPGDGSARSIHPYLQASCVGGASNINGMAADRGQPGDYELWQEMGASGWSWSEVLPYFKKLEHDLDFKDDDGSSMHGSNGPMPVRRLARPQWPPFSSAIADSLERRGFRFIEDYNSDFGEGFSSVPTNCLERRISASMAYLTREVRQRRNLNILPNAIVYRLNTKGKRVDGAIVRTNGAEVLIKAREVIVSCGALQTPTLLLRSGVGPSQHLAENGIEVVHDLAGVGGNLQNHPCVTIPTYLTAQAAQSRDNVWFLQNCLRFSSHLAGCEKNDMHLMSFNKCAWHSLGSRVGAVFVSVLNPYSRGTVKLAADAPKIQFNFLSEPRDFDRLVKGMRLALELLADENVRRLHYAAFTPNPQLVASLDPRTAWNRVRSAAITWILDRNQLRDTALGGAQIDSARLLADAAALREFVRRNAAMQYHVCGTCRMGTADDPNAVVDGSGRVHGVDALRVVDTSIFPTIPRGYTHFVVIMAAEKIADSIKAEWG